MHLKTLNLKRIEKALDKELALAAKESLPTSEVLEHLLAIEANALIERRVERRIKESKLPERKLLATLILIFKRGWIKDRLWNWPNWIL